MNGEAKLCFAALKFVFLNLHGDRVVEARCS
jgi:hypothetical protein